MKSDNTASAGPIQKQQEITSVNNQRSGHWTPAEHKLYLDFLYQSQDLIESSHNNKGQRLFKKMSSVIATRTPSQLQQYKKKKKWSKLQKATKEFPCLMKSKQYFRKLFASQRRRSSESIEEEELSQNIQ